MYKVRVDDQERLSRPTSPRSLRRRRANITRFGYGTARTFAGQIGRPDIAAVLTSLGEEETGDNLLTQIARELMSQARTGLRKGPMLVAKEVEATDEKTGKRKLAKKR
jgi:Domain of unknown function (DUF892)